MNQPTFQFQQPPVDPLLLQARQWIADNPVMWRMFCDEAKEYERRDQRVGAKRIVEVLRWDTAIRWPEGQGFKINNTLTRYLALEAIALYPQLVGTLTTRKRND